jgi:hypothetical protein
VNSTTEYEIASSMPIGRVLLQSRFTPRFCKRRFCLKPNQCENGEIGNSWWAVLRDIALHCPAFMGCRSVRHDGLELPPINKTEWGAGLIGTPPTPSRQPSHFPSACTPPVFSHLTARPYVGHRVCRLAGIPFGNPSVALSLVAPRRGHRTRILRPCLLAPSDTSASPEPSSRH